MHFFVDRAFKTLNLPTQQVVDTKELNYAGKTKSL